MKLSMRKKDAPFWCINILLFLIECGYMLAYWDKTTTNWSEMAFYFSIVSIIANILTIVHLKIKISDFRVSFLALTYIFMFGRIWLNYLNLDADIFWVLHKFFDIDTMFKASLFTICCTQALFIGLFIQRKYDNDEKHSELKHKSEQSDVALLTTAFILLVIGIPCRLITDINAVISTAATGNYNSITVQSGLVDDFAHLFIPGLLCFFECRPKSKNLIIVFVMVYYVAIMSVTGDRRYYVAGILALGAYFLFHSERKKRKKNPLLILGLIIFAMVFLNFLQIVREMRLGDLGSISSFISNYGSDFFVFDDLLFEVLAEFGISFFSLVSIISNIPNVLPYQLGMSFIRTIPSVLPIGSIFGDFFEKASPSTIINAYTGYPVGATLFGDLYANFNLLAVPLCIYVGMKIHKIFSKKMQDKSSLGVVLYYSSYYILINLVRSTIFEVFRTYIWCTFIPIIIYKLCKKNYDII